jgi:hypothetical protein
MQNAKLGLGTAIAARIAMIATTMSNSMSVKPVRFEFTSYLESTDSDHRASGIGLQTRTRPGSDTNFP